MADLQITGLQALPEASVQATDVLALADLSASETKKITVKNLIAAGVALIDNGDIPFGKLASGYTGGTVADGSITNAKVESSSSATTGIDGSSKIRDGSIPVVKFNISDFNRGISVVGNKLGITNSITANTTGAAKVKYDAQGLVTGTASLTGSDLPLSTSSSIGGVKVESSSLLTVSNTGALDVKNVSGLSAGTYATVTVNAKGQVTSGSTTAGAVNIPAATTTAKGGVIVPASGGLSVDGSGNLSIATQGSVSTGSYTKLTVNTKGVVTGTGSLVAADLPNHSAALLTSGTIPAARIGSNAINADRIDSGAVTNAKVETSTSATTGLDGATKLRDGSVTAAKLNTANIDRGLNVAGGNLGINNSVTAATGAVKVNYSAQGLITGSSSLAASDLPKATSSAVGGVSAGSGLSVNGSGVLSLSNSIATGSAISGITWNSHGQITAIQALGASDIPLATSSAIGGIKTPVSGGLETDGSGNLSISTTGVSAGDYFKVTVNTKGQVTAGASSLVEANIPTLPASKITS